MELFFESRQEITKIEGKLYFFQAEPRQAELTASKGRSASCAAG